MQRMVPLQKLFLYDNEMQIRRRLMNKTMIETRLTILIKKNANPKFLRHSGLEPGSPGPCPLLYRLSYSDSRLLLTLQA